MRPQADARRGPAGRSVGFEQRVIGRLGGSGDSAAGGPSAQSFTPQRDRALMNRMTDETAQRMAKNEAHFRGINERVKDGLLHARGGLAERDDLVGFVCECSNLECSDLVYAPASVLPPRA